jgi:hypothetical protein
MPVYIYTNLGERIEIKGAKPRIRRFTEIPRHDDPGEFKQRILNQYRRKEEIEGARFRSPFTKSQIKKAWEN